MTLSTLATGNGQWMAEELGGIRRRQHYVPFQAPEVVGLDGWVNGFRAACGVTAIPAYERYLSQLEKCANCAR